MPRDRVVIVGAGVAGLVSAFALAARGLDVTVLERQRVARRQDAADRDRSGADRQRSDRVHDALGVRRAVRRRRQELRRSRPPAARWKFWRGTPGTSTHGSICLPMKSARSTRSADFAGAAEADGYRAFCRDTKRIYDILEKPFLRALAAEHGRTDRRRRLSRADAAAADQAVLVDVVGARALLRRSTAAATVRTLRHLLRIVALSRAGDLDAGGACRA